jgi:hypothetical protein
MVNKRKNIRKEERTLRERGGPGIETPGVALG